ncbi:hypothetical protein BDF21DRAFT_407386 [Thamnidium elegans]|nr:hypothetical protein BDF21DRAFT_407386 [Thamnidium elegans]
MKFISLLAIAACAVLVSAAPHGGSNHESNQEVEITDKSNTEITDKSLKKAQINDQKKVADNVVNNNPGLVGGLLNGRILEQGIAKGGINILSGVKQNENDKMIASNNDN